MYRGAAFAPFNVRAKPTATAGAVVTGGKIMIIHQHVAKAVQDDAPRAGERNRLLLEARRASIARRERVVPAVPGRRIAGLLLRRASI